MFSWDWYRVIQCTSNRLWNRTLGRYTRAGHPECVVNTMSGPPSQTTQDRIQTNDTPSPRMKIKISYPTGNRTRAAGMEGRDSSVILLILQALSLHLCHSSFSNPSVALPTSQLILQPFCCFTYITTHSPTLLSLFLRHRLFTYLPWRAAHEGFIHLVNISLK